MSRKKDSERAKKASERLNVVLEEVFNGDKNLLAFACGTNLTTLYNWLSGKHAPNGNAMFRLSECVPKYHYRWLGGYTDENDGHHTEYWETMPLDRQHDIFRRDVLLMRELIANRARIYAYQQDSRKRISERIRKENHEQDEQA